MKLFKHIIFFLLCSSCATITSRTQKVAFDSQPRKMLVYDEYDHYLGTTPFVYDLPRSSQLRVLYKDTEGNSTPLEGDCRFRWGESGAGNLIFLYGALIGIPLDLVSGAAFECPDLNTVTVPKKTPTELRHCRRYLVLPPRTNNILVSEEIEYVGVQHLRSRMQECDSLVDPKESESFLFRFGIDHNTERREFHQELYNYLAFETQANTMVDFVLSETVDNQVIMRTTDLYDGSRESSSLVFNKEQLTYYDHHIPWWKVFLAKALPNSIVVGVGDSNPNFEGVNNNTVNTKRQSITNGYFAELASLSNPLTLKEWDTDYDFHISYPIIYDIYNLDIKNETGTSVDSDQFRFFRFLVNLEIEGIIHTPVGAFGLGLGVAPAYLYTRSAKGTLQNHFTVIAPTVSFWYRAFLSQNLFVLAEVLTLNEERIGDERVKRNQFTKSSIGLGYLFPVKATRFFSSKKKS